MKICNLAQCLTCNLFGGTDGGGTTSLTSVAEILAQFFYGDPDLVVSDLVAGFLLLSSVQHHEALVSEAMERDSSGLLESNKEEEDNVYADLCDLSQFSKYAIGIYGWMLFIWSHPYLGMLRLLGRTVRGCCTGKVATIHGDNIFRWHTIALLLECNINQGDIVYANFCNTVCQPAFAVLLDHNTKTIVISIRGTLSFDDVLTDVIAHSTNLQEPMEKVKFYAGEEDAYAHQGMLHAALWLYHEITERKILHACFSPQDRNDKSFSNVTWKNCHEYALKVVGHSLGAGTSVLLTLMLRPYYPKIHCLAYSPPGCVLSQGAAEYSKTFVTSVVLGKDMIARASLQRMHTLRDKVLEMITRAKVSKVTILQQVVSWHHPNDLLVPEGEEPHDVSFVAHLKEYRSMLQLRQDRERVVELYLPGKVIHLKIRREEEERAPVGGLWVCCRPGSDGVCCTSRKNYIARVSHRNEFNEIRISRSMLDDHFPDKVHYVLQRVMKELE